MKEGIPKSKPTTQIGTRVLELVSEIEKRGYSHFASSYHPLKVFKFNKDGKIERKP